jgi:hypothetical protein
MKSLIRSIFKSRKKIFAKIGFHKLLNKFLIKKIQIIKENSAKKRLQTTRPKALASRNNHHNLIFKRKNILKNYLIAHASVPISLVPFIINFIESKGCLFADKLLIEQLIIIAQKERQGKVIQCAKNISPICGKALFKLKG